MADRKMSITNYWTIPLSLTSQKVNCLQLQRTMAFIVETNFVIIRHSWGGCKNDQILGLGVD